MKTQSTAKSAKSRSRSRSKSKSVVRKLFIQDKKAKKSKAASKGKKKGAKFPASKSRAAKSGKSSKTSKPSSKRRSKKRSGTPKRRSRSKAKPAKKSFSIAGLYPPVPTPFKKNGDINEKAFRANLSKWAKVGFRGIVVQGSNGEYCFLSEDERVEVIRIARDATPKDMLIIAGAGMEGTRATINMVNRMAKAGADVAMVITPHYFKKFMKNFAAQKAHFFAVADASPIPILVYNMPANTGIDLSAGEIAELAAHPNIVGLKDSGGNLAKLAWLANEVKIQKLNFEILAGSASWILPAFAIGAVGGVNALANIAGKDILRLIAAFKSGDAKTAMAIQQRLAEPNTAVTAMFGVPGLKHALGKLGFYGGPCRQPLQPLEKGQKAKLEAILRKAGILKK